jgi:hypothetical protein
MEQQFAYDYLEGLVSKAQPFIDKIADEWDLLTLEEVDTICATLREYTEEAQSIYYELPGDNLGIINLVHQLELALQDSEDLYKEKEAKQ